MQVHHCGVIDGQATDDPDQVEPVVLHKTLQNSTQKGVNLGIPVNKCSPVNFNTVSFTFVSTSAKTGDKICHYSGARFFYNLLRLSDVMELMLL